MSAKTASELIPLELHGMTLPLETEAALWPIIGHTAQLANHAVGYTRHLGLEKDIVTIFRFAAPFHDIGKLFLPQEILLKPSGLTAEERLIVQTHVQLGLKHLMTVMPHAPQPLQDITLLHHERYDGEGQYRLHGTEIPLHARIFAILDVYDALRNKRAYKEPWTAEDATSEIIKKAGSMFDTELAYAFRSYLQSIPNEEQ